MAVGHEARLASLALCQTVKFWPQVKISRQFALHLTDECFSVQDQESLASQTVSLSPLTTRGFISPRLRRGLVPHHISQAQ